MATNATDYADSAEAILRAGLTRKHPPAVPAQPDWVAGGNPQIRDAAATVARATVARDQTQRRK